MTRRGFFARLAAVPLVVFVGRKISPFVYLPSGRQVEFYDACDVGCLSPGSVVTIPHRLIHARLKISAEAIADSTRPGGWARAVVAERAAMLENLRYRGPRRRWWSRWRR